MSPFIDFDLINAYVPAASQLSLEDAMKVAIQRDEEAALNLEESVLENDVIPLDLPEGPVLVDVDSLIRELYGVD